MATHPNGKALVSGRAVLTHLPTALLPLLLSSCFTMGLWGFEPTDDRDPVTGREDTSFEYQDDTSWSWGLFGLRVLATPITLCLDCLTAPVQVFLFGNDDDGDDCRADRRKKR